MNIVRVDIEFCNGRGGSRDSVDGGGGLSYGAIFSIIDGTNCSPKAVLVWRVGR